MKSTKSPSWTSRLLGSGAVQLPPHVFEISESALRYASFDRAQGVVETSGYQEVALTKDLFHEGPLGGSLREAESFSRLLDELLEAAGDKVERASLLLPDRWLRTTLMEMEGADAVGSLDEFLRWRLKKMVPFRVEDLRIRAVSDTAGGEGASERLLVGFAVEQLLADLERVFGEHGIRLGLITNRTLPMASALSSLAELRCVVMLAE